MTLRLDELNRLPDDQRADRLKAFAAAMQAPSNGETAKLDRQISEFERTYGMTSDEMRRRLDKGDLRETKDICSWLLVLRRRDRLVQPTP